MGLKSLTLFCDQRPDAEAGPCTSAADIKKFHEASSFSIKSIVIAASLDKEVKEISFIRLSLHPPCVAAVLQAPPHVQHCLKFHGACRLFWNPFVVLFWKYVVVLFWKYVVVLFSLRFPTTSIRVCFAPVV